MASHPPPTQRLLVKKGLDVDLGGRPRQVVDAGAPPASVALIADDHPGLRPDVLVAVGDDVRLGQPLLRCAERPEILLTSPGAGTVAAIERGHRRTLRSITVELGGDAEVELPVHGDPASLDAGTIRETLLSSGLWTAIRERPFGRVADGRSPPSSLFVTALDTDPLAADPAVVLAGRDRDFRTGLVVLSRLVEGPVFLCKAPGAEIPVPDGPDVRVVELVGPHPAGLPGTHMHLVDPAGRGRPRWHVGYQDVAAVGRLFETGRLDPERVVALAGPAVRRPRLLRTRLGASIDDLVRDELEPGPCRVVSGSVLSGRRAVGWGRHLGRHHLAVGALPEEDAGLRGRPGPMIPVEDFERVMPLDLLIAPLLRALVLGDAEAAEDLGCLELAAEDLALCSYVCPGKQDYGSHLRSVLAELAEQG